MGLFKKRFAFSIAAILLVLTSACSKNKEDPEELILGFNPAENAEVVQTYSDRLAEIVKARTGMKLKTYVASDFGSLVEAMRSGKVHMAFLPGFSLIQAERFADAKVLLKSVRHGLPVYYSAIITAKGYKSIDELKGKTIAWTDPSSASGHIMAKNLLMDMNIDPDRFFSKQIFAGGHDALVMAVLNKTVDAGATLVFGPDGKTGIWEKYIKDAHQLSQIKVLKISGPIPADTMATTNKYYSTHKVLVDQFVAMMKTLSSTEDGKKVLYDLYQIDGMVDAKSEEYESLRTAAKRLNIH